MSSIPAKVSARIAGGLKSFQPILDAARARDSNESDTVTIVTDILHEVFGYEKYTEITSEKAIRGTFCDLAIKLDEKLALLIEVKAIGLELKDQHVKQAVDYASNQGCDWVALTNGVVWRVYKVIFGKPIDQQLVLEFDVFALNPRKDEDLHLVWLLCKEGWQKARLEEYSEQRQALSRFTIGALLTSELLIDILRRELKRVTPGTKIDRDEIQSVLVTEVLRREVVEGEKAEAAKKLVARVARKFSKSEKDDAEPMPATGPPPVKSP